MDSEIESCNLRESPGDTLPINIDSFSDDGGYSRLAQLGSYLPVWGCLSTHRTLGHP